MSLKELVFRKSSRIPLKGSSLFWVMILIALISIGASQMLAAGMPVSSLQRYLGHEHLDTTMIYAEVSNPLLRQDYYQGIATLDPGSVKLSMSGLGLTQQRTLRQLVEELKTPGLEQSRHDEILDIILANIS